MYPARFDYHRASSVAQALDLLGSKQDAKLLAGGHSLLPMMKLRLAQPANLIDIGGIKELTGIERSGSSVRIGALTTHAELASSDVLKKACPIVAEAAAKIGDPQVRNRGTIGGNLTHADPGSDLPAVVKALDATLHLQSKKGKRTVKASEFFVDLLTSAVGEGEILTAIEVPVLDGAGAAYLKFEHPASGYAVVGAAAIVRVKGGKCESARLCFNGVTATPLDAQGVAGSLAGKAADDAAIDAAVNGNLKAEDPLGDVFASGEYRVHLAKVFGRRALKLARDRAS
ncbi:MAG TPA: xanthine dehydrogenase family protein subunit M [Thermoanaerobaculia bacterium]|jgi:carbon-monoxide dehydrogenase medium subunit|nr:xanthine dehydrogenase family protein subunit M [Thermoanaerobaculia bacterium]